MSYESKGKADEDVDARRAIWRAICVAAGDVQARCRINQIFEKDNKPPSLRSDVPDVFTWQLVEALSLLCTIHRSNDASVDVLRLFGKTGPVEISEDGVTNYLWAQKNVGDATSGLDGRPDLVVTSSQNQPSKDNIRRVTEIKCASQLGAPIIRSEFGKAYDLRVTSYLIWSYYTPSTKIIEGAKQLGIDIESIGFDTDRRNDLIQSPDALIAKIVNTQEYHRRAQKFGNLIASVSEEVNKKLFKL